MANQPQIRILAVDDHALLRKGIGMLISAESDMQLVAEASTGKEALREFRTHRPDVTLMDLQMPDMNGVEAIIAIRSEFPNARVIVLTTYAGDAQVLRALNAGARGYLLKGKINSDLSLERRLYVGASMISGSLFRSRTGCLARRTCSILQISTEEHLTAMSDRGLPGPRLLPFAVIALAISAVGNRGLSPVRDEAVA